MRQLKYYMNEKNNEQLIRDYPDLFEKSGDMHLSVGDGWYNIISVLCGYISYDVQRARQQLKFALENQGNRHAKPISECEAALKKALEDLPVIQQVKEKYGTLRFYVDGGSDMIHHYIDFAENMSSVTCEECGAPGESRNEGWVKVLCDKHHKERQKETEPYTVTNHPKNFKFSQKLSDE
jgi:hypothetical protein